MNDRIYYEIYNMISKERAILPIDKGLDKATMTRMFYEEYGREGWVMVKPFPYKGGEDGQD
jgi:hypothetical protein